jgi:hypothetical protein
LIANLHDHRWGFPCCYWSPLLACRRHYPGRNVEVDSLVLLHRHRPSPKCRRVGSCIALFEACSAFTHVTACTLAGSPEVTLYTGGFSGFVSSPTAPIATGRSDPVPGRDFSRCDQRLSTAHDTSRATKSGHLHVLTTAFFIYLSFVIYLSRQNENVRFVQIHRCLSELLVAYTIAHDGVGQISGIT